MLAKMAKNLKIFIVPVTISFNNSFVYLLSFQMRSCNKLTHSKFYSFMDFVTKTNCVNNWYSRLRACCDLLESLTII